MTNAPQPRKRQRPAGAQPDDQNPSTSHAAYDAAVVALVERLQAIRDNAISLRDEHRRCASDIAEKIATRQSAVRAAEKVVSVPPSDDVDAFSQGVRADSRPLPSVPDRQTLPVMKLLAEHDPPEKFIHEHSVIVRAQAINRKNAELARERLPKQPEAQRNKTWQDYFLDEAVWMATDFREERKWKIQVARKLAKSVVQYHVQRANRQARSKLEAHQKTVRLANSVARDVRKFWSQICEIADYKSSIVEEARRSQERQQQLDRLLQKTEAYSHKLALRFQQQSDETNLNTVDAQIKQVTFRDGARTALPDRTPADPNTLPQTDAAADNDRDLSDSSDESPNPLDDTSFSGKEEDDDESTMIAAEAGDANNPEEIQTLETEASLSVEELLKSQGIDPVAYKADQDKYLGSDKESDDAGSASEDFDEGSDSGAVEDDESTMKAAEAEDEPVENEGDQLQGEADMSLEDLLRAQGIDPAAYRADKKNYLEDQESKEVNGSHSPDESDVDDEEVPSPVDDEDRTTNGRKPSSPRTAAATARDLKLDAMDIEKPAVRKSNPPVEISRRAPDTSRKTSPPSTSPLSVLLRGDLRDYQMSGMQWLVNLYKSDSNGILADEMGLGKTIQTIALLAWLALEEKVWGPHLVVVPTSVMVNWEVEFKRFLPGFKILTYFGSMRERKLKRKGWMDPDMFHVCITSYTLAVQDAHILRRKKWVYLILDEAHNIKNFKSQRWQTLLTFSARRRLLLTGTPLQNSVMELWSLMHFLMPNIFESHAEFKDWFSNPLQGDDLANESHRSKVVAQLHNVLRPFVLRRLKADVEKGLPPKYEHVVSCPLGKRQRELYEDFVNRSDVRETFDSGDAFKVMNALMQLRKVCNHPDLFDSRPIVSPLSMSPIFYPLPTMAARSLQHRPWEHVNLKLLSLDLCSKELNWPGSWFNSQSERMSILSVVLDKMKKDKRSSRSGDRSKAHDLSDETRRARERATAFRQSSMYQLALVNGLRLRERGLIGEDVRDVCTISPSSLLQSLRLNSSPHEDHLTNASRRLVWDIDTVALGAKEACERFVCCITKASAPSVEVRFQGDDQERIQEKECFMELSEASSSLRSLFRSYEVRSQVSIPDKRLVQWDCGKLQVLNLLLRKLRRRSSRVLIFTQMTKMLDVLESFLNLHMFRYLRLDGTTKTDDRQKVVQRFNSDKRIFCMILTTRAGGVGLNLTGADSVIFYDTDFNPAIDNQAQDRAHRIGQTKTVNIYRLVCENTVEESILERANVKRALENQIISEAGFTTDAIKQLSGRPGEIPAKPSLPNAANKDGSHKKNGFHREPNEASQLAAQKGNITRVAVPSYSGIEGAHGLFEGFRVDPDDEAVHDRRSHSPAGGMNFDDEAQKINSDLLEGDDEREQIALDREEQERLNMEAEFDEGCADLNVHRGAPSKEGKKSSETTADLESSLSPIQRYALRFIERHQSSTIEEEHTETINDRLAEKDRDVKISRVCANDSNETVKEANDTITSDKITAMTAENEDDVAEDDELFYELDLTETGRENYLKVLTDADVDIKLYLPLRDGGPEELKVSSVVSGTAAVGLECAEDAAFFPHAYNRMSRTPYATTSQREKGLANLRKRRAEKEAKKQKEGHLDGVCNSAVAQDSMASPAAFSDRSGQASNDNGRSNVSERSRASGLKRDSVRFAVPPTNTKKIRVEGVGKNKSIAGGSSGVGSSSDGLSTGLFKKPKKSTRKLLAPGGKISVGALSGNQSTGGGTGLNEGWTKEEEEALISIAALHNNNMLLVSDILNSDSRVAVGMRQYRDPTHCIQRLVLCLSKENRSGSSGPPVSTVSEVALASKHSEALRNAVTSASQKPPPRLAIPSGPTHLHPSHEKAIAEAMREGNGLPHNASIPTVDAVKNAISVPSNHRPGLKSTETTAQALNKLRYPFLRPLHDESRSRGSSAHPMRYNGTTPSTHGLTIGAGSGASMAPAIFARSGVRGTRVGNLTGIGRGSKLAVKSSGSSSGGRGKALDAMAKDGTNVRRSTSGAGSTGRVAATAVGAISAVLEAVGAVGDASAVRSIAGLKTNASVSNIGSASAASAKNGVVAGTTIGNVPKTSKRATTEKNAGASGASGASGAASSSMPGANVRLVNGVKGIAKAGVDKRAILDSKVRAAVAIGAAASAAAPVALKGGIGSDKRSSVLDAKTRAIVAASVASVASAGGTAASVGARVGSTMVTGGRARTGGVTTTMASKTARTSGGNSRTTVGAGSAGGGGVGASGNGNGKKIVTASKAKTQMPLGQTQTGQTQTMKEGGGASDGENKTKSTETTDRGEGMTDVDEGKTKGNGGG